MKASVDMSSSISIWMALQQKQVKRSPYLLQDFRPCLVRNGPKTSIPQNVNGGDGSIRSEGMFAIFCSSVGLRNLQHLTHCRIKEDTVLLTPIIQNPLDLISFIVKPFP